MTCVGEEFGYKNSCGVFGECIESYCECRFDWEQSTEFSFMLEEDSLGSNETLLEKLPCDAHFGIISTLYLIYEISVVINFLVHVAFIRKIRQLKRLLPWLLCLISYIVGVTYKLNDVENINFGEDFCFTLFFSLANISSCIFLNKYIYFQQKMISFSSKTRCILCMLLV
eukprot:snap_masked-scaffold_7-processed-gene-3.47-mRNA-1 protein AED:1.00 eAED:1.00 QI:0/0/0/0/1/1/3/0/169